MTDNETTKEKEGREKTKAHESKKEMEKIKQ